MITGRFFLFLHKKTDDIVFYQGVSNESQQYIPDNNKLGINKSTADTV